MIAEFQCVYSNITGGCSSRSGASREDYLPRLLGSFQGYEVLKDRLCTDCNNRLGALDDVFAHHSPEAVCRDMIDGLGRKKHRKKLIHREATFGIPPMKTLGKLPQSETEIRYESNPANPRAVQPMAQVILETIEGSRHPVLISREKMPSMEDFEGVLAAKGLGLCGAQLVEAFVSPEDMPWFRTVARRYLWGRELIDKGEPALDGGNVETTSQIKLSPMYHRAIAKTGFHFLLKFCRSITGLEPELTALKTFITAGRITEQFLRKTADPVVFEYRGFPGGRWMHILGYQTTQEKIVVDVMFFAGMLGPPQAWEIMIPGPHKIPSPESKTYAYSYWQGARKDQQGHHGVMDQIPDDGDASLDVCKRSS